MDVATSKALPEVKQRYMDADFQETARADGEEHGGTKTKIRLADFKWVFATAKKHQSWSALNFFFSGAAQKSAPIRMNITHRIASDPKIWAFGSSERLD